MRDGLADAPDGAHERGRGIVSVPWPSGEQWCRGAGISMGEMIDARVSIDYVTESRRDRTGPWVERLAAVAVWRGRPGWLGGRWWLRDALATIWPPLRRRQPPPPTPPPDVPEGWMRGGSPQGNAWTVFDPERRVLHIRGQAYPLPDDGSTLVLLIDRADDASRPPAVATRTLPSAPRARPERAGPTAPDKKKEAAFARAVRDEHRAMSEIWRALVHGDPVVRAFIEQKNHPDRDPP
jgi:hypothetical protein